MNMCFKYSLPLVLILLQVIYYSDTKRIAKKIIVIEDFGMCLNIDEKEMSIRFYNTKFGMISGSKSELSYEIKTNRTITDKLHGQVTVKKCPTVHGDEDCETYFVVKVKDYCQKFIEKNQAWSFAFDNVQPPITCPIQKGFYRSKGTPDLEKLKWLIDDTNVFKIYLHIFENNKFISCIRIVLKTSIVRVYVKDKVSSQEKEKTQ